MKKTILSSAIILSLGTAVPASALNVSVTSMDFLVLLAAEGTLTDTGTYGSMNSIDPFKGQHWTADAIAYFDTTGSGLTWAGTSIQGAYSYTFTLSPGQVAWGTFFSWSGNNDIPLLNIMDCGAGNIGDLCTGIGTPMQTNPFPGQIASFNGVVSTIPAPASLWLFGSGLAAISGIARRKTVPSRTPAPHASPKNPYVRRQQ